MVAGGEENTGLPTCTRGIPFSPRPLISSPSDVTRERAACENKRTRTRVGNPTRDWWVAARVAIPPGQAHWSVPGARAGPPSASLCAAKPSPEKGQWSFAAV
ncbi:hypothetical protein E4U53_004807 [Claviceps sorghi]|nr:hypothetical protein E4U53_004807 [Claviceps sorghi]